jgi:hypothetical protein
MQRRPAFNNYIYSKQVTGCAEEQKYHEVCHKSCKTSLRKRLTIAGDLKGVDGFEEETEQPQVKAQGQEDPGRIQVEETEKPEGKKNK